MLWGGDLNFVRDRLADSTSKRRTRGHGVADALRNVMAACELEDVWRTLHPRESAYTFFSPVHGVYSRLDYWLLSARWLLRVRGCEISARSLSDHSPGMLTIQIIDSIRRGPPWHLHGTELMDPVFLAEIGAAIEESSVDSASVLWEAFKVYITGICIAKWAGVLRSIRNRLSVLEDRLVELERSHAQTSDPHLLADIHEALAKFREEVRREVVYLRKHAPARVFGEGDRPGKTLAWLYRTEPGNRLTVAVQSAAGEIVTDLL